MAVFHIQFSISSLNVSHYFIGFFKFQNMNKSTRPKGKENKQDHFDIRNLIHSDEISGMVDVVRSGGEVVKIANRDIDSAFSVAT